MFSILVDRAVQGMRLSRGLSDERQRLNFFLPMTATIPTVKRCHKKNLTCSHRWQMLGLVKG